jgi:glycosyltransferase involved in cell wall biosynthesis
MSAEAVGPLRITMSLVETKPRQPEVPLGSKRRPRVLLVLHDLGPVGGMERACTELIRYGSSEFDFTILSGTLSDQLRRSVTWSRIPLIEHPFPLKFLLFYVAAAFRIRGYQADLVHTVGAIVPNRVDLASVHYCHVGFHRQTGRLAAHETVLLRRINAGLSRLLAIAAERWSYRTSRTSRLAAVSPGVAAELAQHFGNIPVHLTPNGVDTERFNPSWPDRPRFRELAGGKDGDIVAVFVGGEWSRKGLAIAIRGLALAQRQVDRWLRLWVVGPGDAKRFAKIAQACGVGDQVTFFGRRTDVERFYQSADVFVLPTLYETFSLAAYEAAACGLPLVATRVSGIEELVGENEAGVLVERTPDAVGEALGRLAVDAKARVQMGRAGRLKAKSFTWQRSADAVLDVYRLLLAEKRVPSTSQQPPLRESGGTEAGW